MFQQTGNPEKEKTKYYLSGNQQEARGVNNSLTLPPHPRPACPTLYKCFKE
jgi:hypothetical protein